MLSNLYSKFRRITSSKTYIPEVDGIRFLAIILVILFHSHGYFSVKSAGMKVSYADNPATYSVINAILENGDRGVPLFFVLSGFILCLPFALFYLRKEKKVSLKKYFLRRITRLEPPYIIAISALFILQLVLHTQHDMSLVDQLKHYFASLTYTHGLIYHQTPIITVVAWSLEIEIQFYILAPLFFSVLQLPIITRRLILIGSAVLFMILQHLFPQPFLSIYGFIQYFLMGILLADLHISYKTVPFINKNWAVFAAAALVIAICLLPSKEVFLAKFLLPFIVCCLFFIVFKNDKVKAVFSYKFIPIIGGMCYSIYLLHYSLISFLGRFFLPIRLTNYYLPNLLFQLIAYTIPVIVISSIFYLYVERPFMDRKWTDKLMKKENRAT